MVLFQFFPQSIESFYFSNAIAKKSGKRKRNEKMVRVSRKYQAVLAHCSSHSFDFDNPLEAQQSISNHKESLSHRLAIFFPSFASSSFGKGRKFPSKKGSLAVNLQVSSF